jgi:hypothetical protein
MPQRRFWLKRRFMLHRWFGKEGRVQLGQHWELTFREWCLFNRDLRKRRNPFVKRPWLLRNVDRHGRPRNHPLFQPTQNSN